MKPSNLENTWNSLKLENAVYDSVKKYFDSVSIKDIRPNSWKVPIGGGFYGHEEVIEVVKCYLNGSLSIQKPVIDFENKFSDYIGTNYGIATNSGTSANILALNALIDAGYLELGDEIVVPATTFISVATPILQLGLIPVYVDVEVDTLNIDLNELERVVNDDDRNIKGVMIVHTLGNPVDMNRVNKIIGNTDVQIIEDCCEAHGAECDGKKIGSYGIMSTWSFYVAHHMTTAEGGMVLTDSKELDIILRELREFGRDKEYSGERYGMNRGNLKDFDERYTFHRVGWNFRMADAPASFGIQQLKKLDDMNKIRLKHAEYLIENLSQFNQYLQIPSKNTEYNVNTFYSFPIIIKKNAKIQRKNFVRYLESQGIETRAIMCGTLPDQPSLCNEIGIEYGELSQSRYIRDNGFFIGCHPCLEEDDLKYVIETITSYFKQQGDILQ